MSSLQSLVTISQENGRAKQDVGAANLSRIEFSQNILVQPDLSSQQLMTEVNDINGANVVCTEPDHQCYEKTKHGVDTGQRIWN